MGSSFKDNSRKWDAFTKSLPAMEKLEVVIGIQAGDTDKKTQDLLVTRAVANELGTRNIPARPFISTASDENRPAWWKRFDMTTNQVWQGRARPDDPFESAGQAATRDIQRKIDSIQNPPNSPRTIAMKGSSNPLINSGQMRQGIRHEVRRAGYAP